MQILELFKAVGEDQSFFKIIFSGSEMQAASSTIKPTEGSGAQLWNADTAVLILYGEGEVKVGDEIKPVKTGDFILVPNGTPYDIVNMGKENLKVIYIFSESLYPEETSAGNKISEILNPYKVHVEEDL